MKYSIFSPQRVGSTLMMSILWPYLHRKIKYVENLHELQNPAWALSDEKNKIKTNFYLRDRRTTNIQQCTTIDYNFKLIQKYHHQNYLIKFMSFPAITENQELWNYILSYYHLIMVERKNKKEQLLSLIISKETRKWSTFNNNDVIKPPMIVFNSKIGNQFIKRINNFEKLKKIILDRKTHNSWIVYYEDLIQLENPFQILETFGFHDWKKYISKEDHKKLPIKQNPYDKLQFISNKDEFNEWFESSGL